MATVWGLAALLYAQHKYFTRADEQGNARLHPITRWILWHRQSETDRNKQMMDLLLEARQEGEAK